MENDENATVQVIMWRTDNIGAIVKVWTYSERGVFRAAGTLMLEREFLEEMLSEVIAAEAVANDMTLF